MKPKTVRRAQTEVESLAVFAQTIEDRDKSLPCGFAAGTCVLTHRGEMPVEKLKAGDRIITRDVGMVRLKSVSTHFSPTAYRIRASVLGHDRPVSDLLVAEGQRILLRDWRAKAMYGEAEAMVPASRLVDGHFIAKEITTGTIFYALTFETPHILYVDSVEVASAEIIPVSA